jgi:hypothetical protein
VLAASVQRVRDFRNRRERYVFHCPTPVLRKAGSVNDVTDMFLAARSVLRDVCCKGILKKSKISRKFGKLQEKLHPKTLDFKTDLCYTNR